MGPAISEAGRMRKPLHIAMILPLLLLGACRSTLGLISEVPRLETPPLPDRACIEAAIRRAPAVTDVRFEQESTGFRHRMRWAYQFGGRHYAWLTISGRDDTDIDYSNFILLQGSREAAPLLDRFEPLLRGVDRQIEADCGVKLEGRTQFRRFFNPSNGVF